MTNDEYLQLVEENGDITIFGYGTLLIRRREPTLEEWEQARLEGRERLRMSHRDFEYCCDWIKQHPEMRGRHEGGYWAREVEHWLRANGLDPDHIRKGSFILAAVYMGYRVHRMKDDIDVRIGKRIEQ